MEQRRILVVESEYAFAEQIRSALEHFNCLVEIAREGSEGLKKAKSEPPDLILLCVELPNMSGYSICNKLKKNHELKNIPLIIMSADATTDIFEQHKKLKTRAEEYLLKPFRMQELLEKVGELIELPPPSSREEGQNTQIDSLISDEYHEQTINNNAIDVALSTELEVEDDYILGNEDPANLGVESVDNEISAATDAAFAALEIPTAGKPEDDVQPMEGALPSEAAQAEDLQTEGEPISAPPVEALEMSEVEFIAEEMAVEDYVGHDHATDGPSALDELKGFP